MMLRFALVAGLAWFSSTWLLSTLERWTLYAFDPTSVAPQDAGLSNVTWKEFYTADNMHVVWTASAQPGKPTIIYFHGNAGNLAQRAQRFGYMLDRGYGLVALAYSGSSGSQGTPSQDNMIASAAQLWASIDSYSDPASPKVIYGESIGSAVTLHLIGTQSNVTPAAVILEAPFTNLIEVGSTLYPQLATVIPQVLKDTWDNTVMAPKLTAPLLVIHGTKDALIPQSMGRKIYGLAASAEKNFHSVQGAGHINTWQPTAQRALWRFIDTYGRP
ncbi:alpha/beta hydrolase [Algirhabdus cladophorae]|uniref:alpha/beta hydrolase n=1 Tax=Algirhabdus cladophorae TaxID=3377108 RepID=UPI003B848CB9